MKKLVYGMAIILTFSLSSTAFAGYVIKLKNGRTVEAENYWQEKGEIKFVYHGGVASFPGKNVLSIAKVEKKPPEKSIRKKETSSASGEVPRESKKTAPPPTEKFNPAGGKKEIVEGPKEIVEGKKEIAEGKKEAEVEHYKRQKAFYTEQFEQAYQRYLEATSRRDPEAKKKAWDEFNNYGGKVISMEAELKKKNNGEIPSWWKE